MMPASATKLELEERLRGLAHRLGYAVAEASFDDPSSGGNGYYTSFADYDGETYQHVIRQAFELVGVHAVFGFQAAGASRKGAFTPIVYLAAALDRADATRIHRQVWSQGVVPILLLTTAQGVEIRSSLGPPPDRPVVIDWALIEDARDLPTALHQVTRVSLAGSLVWSDFAVERRHRVDSSLLSAIKSLSAAVLIRYPALSFDAALVNAVIGRFLYFYILLDRKIISRKWISGLGGCPTISQHLTEGVADMVWPAEEVWALFDAIDETMNGSIFVVTPTQRASLDADLLHLVRRAIRNRDEVTGTVRQPGFFEVSFNTLRTETISAIYELFLDLDDPGQKIDDGAFYTPPFLVDYVLDELDRTQPLTGESRVIDPAAGSGAFLVGAYRRILERSLPGKVGYRAISSMKELLLACIFGVEKNGQAASVARFSLYLTMLDYLDGVDIEKIYSATSPEKVFPALDLNVVEADIFDDSKRPGGPSARFTHVIGNPPWTSYGESRTRAAKPSNAPTIGRDGALERARAYASKLSQTTNPISNFRLSELFVWKANADLLSEEGVIALLLSARSFVSRSADAFPAALLKQMRFLGAANLSHFRYRLFENARTPAVALFARRGTSNPLDKAWIFSPQLSSQPIANRGHLWSIIVSPADVTDVRIRDLQRSPNAWFRSMMLRPLDRRFAELFEIWTEETGRTFGTFLQRNDLVMVRGGTPAQTGVPSTYILSKGGDYRQRLGLTGLKVDRYALPDFSRNQARGIYKRLFAGNVVLVPRSMETADFIEQPIAFNSSFKAIARADIAVADPEGMRGLAAFLGSSLGRYLGAIHGRTWIMDRLRMETGDLFRMPFPFQSLEDADLKSLADAEDQEILSVFSNALGLGPAFAEIVNEYDRFRIGFEDAQLPSDAFQPPTRGMVEAYTQTLFQELGRTFGTELHVQARKGAHVVDGFLRTYIEVADGSSRRPVAEDWARPENFSPASFTPGADIAVDDNGFIVSKPFVKKAWTLDQAFSDANAIVALVAEA